MEQALQGTVEKTSVASVVETATDDRIRRPSRVDRTSIQ